eukprot:CAMPEP_0114328660 /NCGR_PEP_ID=MMETSP0101-20121206/563_1 /TAXON_ID=38822 ORGANISM="Pteridomonas danica, Strain PT" /NCGR_SAMPLE_ID=MMETSP0101 /ASSEMBLY_ACC=CAM_ASM_000211 /LENGTH=51 /DNA_ID=CAMNT_0001458073 /DNA_START=92 /DNA_END=250 /DNA_ORIENTATION=-
MRVKNAAGNTKAIWVAINPPNNFGLKPKSLTELDLPVDWKAKETKSFCAFQ